MTLKQLKSLLLLTLTALTTYYILIVGFNVVFKLAVPNEPNCNPVFCKEILREDTNCLLKTPGFSECINVQGHIYVLSATFAYSILTLCFGVAFYFSRRFYLSRILIVLLFFAFILFGIRVALGGFEFSSKGIFVELNKLGILQNFVVEGASTLFKLFNPKF